MIDFPIRFSLQQLDKDGAAIGSPEVIRFDARGDYSIGRDEACDVTLPRQSVSRKHATLIVSDKMVRIRDEDSTNGTLVNGESISLERLVPGDVITLGTWQMTWLAETARAEPPQQAPEDDAGVTQPDFDAGRRARAPDPAPEPQQHGFPGALFGGQTVVSVRSLMNSGHPVTERRFCAVGAGLGSFVWVDHLRCYGVSTSDIAVIGPQEQCYATYKRYCKNSQIPDHERLRSNSLSRPDNIWGFPGYALREVGKGIGTRGIFQVFGEPTLAESYTPRAGDVFDSLDIEARRIGWDSMLRKGDVRGLRKTDDGRYAIAFRKSAGEPDRNQIVIADVVHISTGYPATRFVDDFQSFVSEHPEHRHRVANAYEVHDEMYDAAERSDGPVDVVVRGRGIVASRIIQRLSEARARNPQIRIHHSMRGKLGPRDGATFGRARRLVRGNVEIQPFNWPKSCWGGDLRFEYEAADAETRGRILAQLGGTTTAERSDWIEIAARGTEEGWYKPLYGVISDMEPVPGAAGGKDKVRIGVDTPEGHRAEINADYLIDCTGLIGDINRSVFLKDLLETYDLPRNHAYSLRNGRAEKRGPTGLAVSNDFEFEGLRNGSGRVYGAGSITVGGPYLAVDSFLGLQYSALRSVDQMVRLRAHGVRDLTPLKSFVQWTRWMRGVAP